MTTPVSTQKRAFLGPIGALLVYIAIFAVVMVIVGPTARAWAAPYFSLGDVRSMAAFRGAFAILFGWLNLALAIFILWLRGQTLSDIGWRKPAAIWGWILALAVVGFLAWSAFFSGFHFLDRSAWLSDWSFFRIAMMLGIGFTAGICEEAIFRGFVMTQARDAHMPVVVQIVLSGVLFGLAHVGWGGLTEHFDAQAAFSAFASTTVFGALFAVVYILARRSLTPGIVGHTIFGMIMEPWMVMMGIAGTLHIGH